MAVSRTVQMIVGDAMTFPFASVATACRGSEPPSATVVVPGFTAIVTMASFTPGATPLSSAALQAQSSVANIQ